MHKEEGDRNKHKKRCRNMHKGGMDASTRGTTTNPRETNPREAGP